jgi:L-threonylcarbamoyladenylate synthase
VCNVPVEVYVVALKRSGPESLPSPGVGIRHYAPHARVVIVEGTSEAVQSRVAELVAEAQTAEGAGVLLPIGWPAPAGAIVQPWAAWDDPNRLAATLFAGLRALDARGVGSIICPLPESGGVCDAIRDRLLKAARER